MIEKKVTEAIQYRRSVRFFETTPLDDEIVKKCIENAALAPTSSNLQLWEFYHITDQDVKKQIATACFNQKAAKTAQQLVVVVSRKDLWRKRARANIRFIDHNFDTFEGATPRRLKTIKMYYEKGIPTLHADFLGITGILKYVLMQIVGLFRPVYRQTRASDLRVVAQKSAGLAAQNFMISMAAVGYDTCPMEGHDSLLVKRALGLRRGPEINMVIGCGIRNSKGIYGKRFRIPFNDVYKKI